MRAILISCILAYLLTVCLGQIGDDSLKYVTRECDHRLMGIDSIEKFETFMEHYENVIKSFTKPKKGLLGLDKPLRTCFDLKEPLSQLEIIVSKRNEGVCRMSYIDQLVEFHLHYLVKNKSGRADSISKYSSVRSSYVAHFFSLFVHQVAYICKSKLIDRVKVAQKLHDCAYILYKFIPPALLDDNQDNEDQRELAGMKNFLNIFTRVEDFAPIIKQEASSEPYFNVIIPDKRIEKIESLKSECRLRKPYYTSLFSPVATLAQLGYHIGESTADSDHLESDDTRILKCWLATAQLCQGILRTHLNISHQLESLDNEKKLVEIKFGNLPNDARDVPSEEPSLALNDTVNEISSNVIAAVKKKTSSISKMKRKALLWARNFIERHIDIEGKRNEAIGTFVDALIDDENSIDTAVSFNGRKDNHGIFNPTSLITDDTDTFMGIATVFLHKEMALLFSCVVAIALSVVFVWFTAYAFVATMNIQFSGKNDTKIKAEYLDLRNKRMKSLEDKIKQKGWLGRFKVYKPNY